MYGTDTVSRAYELARGGLTQTEIAQQLGIGQTTVSRWLRRGPAKTLSSPMRRRAGGGCPEDCEYVVGVPSREYAYLLGQYLGDCSVARAGKGVYRLFVTCCAAYPAIIDECEWAIRAVLPHNRVGRRTKKGAIDVNAYSKHWPCLFPQHGPGRKHTRAIVLAPWQTAIALDEHPDRFVRGLVHSDGCRSLNTISVARRESVEKLESIVGPKA